MADKSVKRETAGRPPRARKPRKQAEYVLRDLLKRRGPGDRKVPAP
jgi:hypothetical protein